ncbi:HTTM domain-containing protein [Bernardetia sp. ABR2-2B]|uniref:HTTM domain-containing protein n=1 Tax=Bernardetia sp. ABR2-2B TaxID=3127472 RepID=UPI0030CB0203
MKKIYNFFEKLYDKKIDPTGLALFRIFFGLVLLGEILQLFYFKGLIFQPQAMSIGYEFSFNGFLLVWFISICFFIVGLFTRYVTIINYVYSVLIFGTSSTWEYHVDYIYMGVGFVLVFTSISETLSLDSLIKAYKNKTKGRPIQINNVSVLNYFAILFVGIGLVYFDSVFHKSVSTTWANGLGVWKPASLPQLTFLDLNWLMNQKYLMIFASYLTLFLEFIFVFIFWHKKARLPIFIVGLGLHIGILIAFPIPWFALTMIALYILLIPLHFIKGINQYYIKLLRKIIKENVDKNSTPSFPLFKKVHIYLIMICFAFMILLQFGATYRSPLINKIITDNELGASFPNKVFTKVSKSLAPTGRIFFGIVPHSVFLDFHYTGYNHLVAVTYVEKDKTETWLPIATPRGQSSWYNTGRNWAKIGFRTVGPNIDSTALAGGIKRFTEFYAVKNDIDLEDATFKVKVKKVDIPMEWEKDFLKKQMNKPWQDVSEAKWINGEFFLTLPDIESL